MNSRQKCCLHCPGTWVSSQIRREHTCRLPTYIKGNLKLSSLKEFVAGEGERQDRLVRKDSANTSEKRLMSRGNSVYDRFAIAKKFHAENLEHQPLPDKVDDSVFRNVRPGRAGLHSKSSPVLTKIDQGTKGHKIRTSLQYGPSLGCKVPTTNMDLAICWEAPVDPNYEPTWPVHIDGSDGGPAPAVFALVQHEPGDEKAFKSPVERFEAKFINVKGSSRRDDPTCDTCHANETNNELCENFDGIHISDESDDNRLVKSATYGCPNPRKRQPVHLRNCVPCHCRGERFRRARYSHSAPHLGVKNVKRNGLPSKNTVPRPRTPYAKRNFCIDTLTPPFTIVEGSRDADYPEHWRLTSVYQQSYRNPKNQ
ncbi:uncharacterized protein [Fopius arisanus]|uniref:DUF4812 domain-containing protein n=1 Tax=Fopius arisanus TaxID=64838 RepID=A0A9R1U8V3_9HYME|nr:PREDICTED: uncharacterized protein LOC105271623 [Fopius arisanus]XP_011311589.1 PREDICTED: uncharacterized protein LOC105271623 [Fopius arisanus]XP_011311590.1 PREDICTED: uncharacterized protein LOC105271623 [Fopius arisanus]XP_011311591.1 PREDICTED: uncharacterized protein LOC105271623 [Fopius arisanus]